MLKRTLRLAFTGFILGMAIGNIIAIVSSYAAGGEVLAFSPELLEKTGSAAAALLLQTLLSGLMGAVSFGGVILYEIDSLPLPAVSIIHCAMILAVYYPIAFSLYWLKPTVRDTGTMGSIMIAAYAVIWLIMYVCYRMEVREMNDLLEVEIPAEKA